MRLLHFTRQVSRSILLRRTTAYSPCIQHTLLSLPPSSLPSQPLPNGSLVSQRVCGYSSKPKLTEGETAIVEKLQSKFPGAKTIEVSDISGGCGAMYQISVEAEEFRGKKTVLQHRLVNEALAEEIKQMHGLQLNTRIPADSR
ncbi:hypothetical protein ACOMHN_034493 [Nucella lapillus]